MSLIHLVRLAVILVSVFSMSVFSAAKYWDRSITILLAEGQEDCYFVPNVKTTNEVDVEYQVTNTKSVYTSGDLKISAKVFDPKGAQIASDDSSDYGSHSFSAQFDGDYKICLDNRYVSAGDKTVYLEIELSEKRHERPDRNVDKLPEGDGGEEYDDDVYNYEYDEDEYIEEDEMKNMKELDKDLVKTFDLSVKEIKHVLQELRQHVGKAQHYQSLMNSMKAKDYHLLTISLSRVNMWSLVHISVLLFTGLVQVYVVRSLFDDKMNMVRKVFGTR